MKPTDYQKFLPSKKFIYVIALCAGGVLLVLIISSLWGSHGKFSKSGTAPVEATGTVKDLVVQDSNGNGIADWEESLWGLDPKGDGPKNKSIIDQKKASADISTDTTATPTTPTDQFSQQLLGTILALNQSGSLTPEALAQLSDTVAKNVVIKHAEAFTYGLSDLKIVPAGARAKATYKAALKKIINQYQDLDLGSEQTIISDGLGNGGASSLSQLKPYADAYTAISREVIALPTPKDIASSAIVLANSSAEMGTALLGVQNLYTDVITGMVGIDDYTNAKNTSDQVARNFSTYFNLQ